MPEWLFELFNPWTTPAALVLAVTGVGWLVGLRGRRLAALAAVVAAGVGLWQGWRIGPPSGLLDLQIYVGSARGWLEGGSLYDYRDGVHHLGATYPPIGPIFFALFEPMSAECREILWTAVSLVALAGDDLVRRRDRGGRAGATGHLVPVGVRRVGGDDPGVAHVAPGPGQHRAVAARRGRRRPRRAPLAVERHRHRGGHGREAGAGPVHRVAAAGRPPRRRRSGGAGRGGRHRPRLAARPERLPPLLDRADLQLRPHRPGRRQRQQLAARRRLPPGRTGAPAHRPVAGRRRPRWSWSGCGAACSPPAATTSWPPPPSSAAPARWSARSRGPTTSASRCWPWRPSPPADRSHGPSWPWWRRGSCSSSPGGHGNELSTSTIRAVVLLAIVVALPIVTGRSARGRSAEASPATQASGGDDAEDAVDEVPRPVL